MLFDRFTAECFTDLLSLIIFYIAGLIRKKHKDLSWNLSKKLPKRVVATSGKAMCKYWYRVLGCFWNFINIFTNIKSLLCYRSVGFSNIARITSNLEIYLNDMSNFFYLFYVLLLFWLRSYYMYSY